MKALRQHAVTPLHNRPLAVVLLLLIAAAGALTVFAVADQGSVRPTSDSIVFIAAARSLNAGAGLTIPYGAPDPTPLTNFPPLYPALLALVGGMLGVDPASVVLGLNSLVFALTLLLVGAAVLRYSGGSLYTAVFAALLTLSGVVISEIYWSLLTEPLYILLGLLGLHALLRYYETDQQRWLLLAGVALALATLTRFAGAALVGTGVLVLLVHRQPVARRLRAVVLLVVLSLLPLVVWLLLNGQGAGSPVNRDLAFNPFTLNDLYALVRGIAYWLWLPDGLLLPVFLLLLLVYVFGMGSAAHSFARLRAAVWAVLRQLPAAAWVYLLFSGVYCLFLLASITFIDNFIYLDQRILSPAYVPLVIAGTLLAQGVLRVALRTRRPAWLSVLLPGLLLALYVQPYATNLPDVQQQFLRDWQSVRDYWAQSGTLGYVRALPPETTVYSNAPDWIYYYTGRLTYALPRLFSPTSLRPNADYAQELAQIATRLDVSGGVLVLFDRYRDRNYYPQEEALFAGLSLRLQATFADGVAYEIVLPPPNAQPIVFFGRNRADGLALTAWSRLHAETPVRACDVLTVETWWQSAVPVAGTRGVSLVLLDAAGTPLAHSAYALLRVPQNWQPTMPLFDSRSLTVPCTLPAGEYRLALGVYAMPGSEGLSVWLPDGTHAGGWLPLETLVVGQ